MAVELLTHKKYKMNGLSWGIGPLTSQVPHLDVYQDTTPKKEWWWRITFLGKIVAASSEGYHDKSDAIKNILRIEEHIKYLKEKRFLEG